MGFCEVWRSEKLNKNATMPKKKDIIPEVDLTAVQQKTFGFQISSNKDILLNESLNHNPFRPHRIRFFAILFILKGEGEHYIDFKTYQYKTGSIIFISKEQVHAFERNINREALFLLFTEGFLEKGSTGSNLMQELSLYSYHLFPPVIYLKGEQLQFLSDLAAFIYDEFHGENDFLTEEIVHSSLKIFLCRAERIRKENHKMMPRSKHHQEFLQFQKLLNTHVLENRKVKFYADLMLMSTKKLNRITQEILGHSAKKHINDFLIIEMKRRLMNTSYTIKEIAYQTGFEETTNFVKYFKKHTHLTPLEFRKQF